MPGGWAFNLQCTGGSCSLLGACWPGRGGAAGGRQGLCGGGLRWGCRCGAWIVASLGSAWSPSPLHTLGLRAGCTACRCAGGSRACRC